MIYKDELDKYIFDNFKENKYIPNKITDCINNVQLPKRKKIKVNIFEYIRKFIVYIIALLTLSTGVVFANDILEVIKNLFKDNKGVETAVYNNYIYSVPEEIKCESEGTETKIKEIIMDDYTLDLNMMITLNNNIDVTNFEKIKIPDVIIYDDMNNVIFYQDKKILDSFLVENNMDKKVLNDINSSANIFIDNANKNIVHFKINISTNGDKLPKSKKLFIKYNTIEIENNNIKYIVSGNWSNNLLVPSKFYNRTSTILHNVLCNDDRIYKNSVIAEVTDTCMKFQMDMKWGDYYETQKTIEERREKNIEEGILIKNNAYAEIDGKRFDISATSDVDGGYSFNIDGQLNYWQTFNLTKYDICNNNKEIKIVLSTYENKEIIFVFKI